MRNTMTQCCEFVNGTTKARKELKTTYKSVDVYRLSTDFFLSFYAAAQAPGNRNIIYSDFLTMRKMDGSKIGEPFGKRVWARARAHDSPDQNAASANRENDKTNRSNLIYGYVCDELATRICRGQMNHLCRCRCKCIRADDLRGQNWMAGSVQFFFSLLYLWICLCDYARPVCWHIHRKCQTTLRLLRKFQLKTNKPKA